jgi:hypothetical protein
MTRRSGRPKTSGQRISLPRIVPAWDGVWIELHIWVELPPMALVSAYVIHSKPPVVLRAARAVLAAFVLCRDIVRRPGVPRCDPYSHWRAGAAVWVRR